MDHVDHDGHRARLRVFPIGVDKVGLDTALRGPECQMHLDRFASEFDGKALVLSVERLDYTKGLPEKLAAIRRFLELTQARKDSRDAAAAAAARAAGA